MNSMYPEVLKEALSYLDRADLDYEAIKSLLMKLYDSSGQFQFTFQVNDLIRKVIQFKRTETARNVIQSLSDISYQINYDSNQINWTDIFKFLKQLSNLEHCIDPVLKMIDKKIYLPEGSINFLVASLVETKCYEYTIKLLVRLRDHAKIAKLDNRSILKSFLMFDNIEFALQFIQLLPFEAPSTLYAWEDYFQYCCLKDKALEAREFMKMFFAKTLPQHLNEAETIYSNFLTNVIKKEGVKEVICLTLEDTVAFKLKVKPNVLKDALLKLLDEKINQKEFYLKVDTLKYNLECREFAALVARLIQLKRKVEVLALIDMIVNENGFKFKLYDLNLSNQEMKYILMAQSSSIRHLLEERDKLEDDSKSVISFKSDHTSIIDRLTFDEKDELDGSFERLSTRGV